MIVFCEKCMITFIGKTYHPDKCPLCRLKKGLEEILEYENLSIAKSKIKRLLEEDP